MMLGLCVIGFVPLAYPAFAEVIVLCGVIACGLGLYWVGGEGR